MNVEKETLYMYIQQCRAMKKEDHRAAVSYIYIQHTQGADKQLGLRRYLYVVVTFFIICADAKGFGSIKKKRAAIKDSAVIDAIKQKEGLELKRKNIFAYVAMEVLLVFLNISRWIR